MKLPGKESVDRSTAVQKTATSQGKKKKRDKAQEWMRRKIIGF